MSFPGTRQVVPLASFAAEERQEAAQFFLPFALLTCSICTASEARILLCLSPWARLIADSLTPERGEVRASEETEGEGRGGGGSMPQGVRKEYDDEKEDRKGEEVER